MEGNEGMCMEKAFKRAAELFGDKGIVLTYCDKETGLVKEVGIGYLTELNGEIPVYLGKNWKEVLEKSLILH